ncbi:MAG TPA: family 16 glycoside hydrolase, partial [Roseiflexaceae bacterium]|nr:family 16 glycoside hydrolase [Roseiflexaceae bacterium]
PPAPPPAEAPGAGGVFGLPPAQPAPTPPPPASPGAGGAFTLPPQTPAPPGTAAAPQGKTNWGLILGIAGGVLALACIALIAGVAIFFQRVGEAFSTLTPEPAVATAGPGATTEFGEVLLTEDFERARTSSFGEGSDSDGSFSIENGAYVITLERSGYFMWNAADGTYGDVAIEVDATVEGPSDGAAALLFRYQDADNFYIFRAFGDGTYSLQRYVANEPTFLVEPTDSAALNGLGQSNRIRIEARGDTITLYANGQLLTEVTDGSFSSGQMALGISAQDEAGVTVRYDNLTIYGQR